jgi:hypothetical protein
VWLSTAKLLAIFFPTSTAGISGIFIAEVKKNLAFFFLPKPWEF